MAYGREAAYGTFVPLTASPNDIYKRFHPREPILLNPTVEKVDDAERIKGHEFPTDPTNKDFIISRDLQIPFAFDASLELFGYLAASAMGVNVTDVNSYVHTAVAAIADDPATANVDESMPAYQRHIMKVSDLCKVDAFPSSSWITGHEGSNKSIMLIKGVIINEMRLTLESKGWIGLTGTAYADGSMQSKTLVGSPISAYVFPDSEHPNDYLRGTQATFSLANHGSNVVSRGNLLRGFEFAINNNLDLADGHGIIGDANIFLSSLRAGTREYTLNVTLEGHQGDEFWEDYLNDVEKVVQIKIEKSNPDKLLQVDIPRCTIDTVTPGFDGIRDTLQLGFKLFFDSTEKSPVKIEVRNTDGAYVS